MVESSCCCAEASAVGKPVVGVEDVVAEDVKQRAMKCICSRLGGHVDTRTWQTTVLRFVRNRRDLHLANRGYRRDAVGSAARGQRRNCSRRGGTGTLSAGSNTEVCADVADHKQIGGRRLSVDGDFELRT